MHIGSTQARQWSVGGVGELLAQPSLKRVRFPLAAALAGLFCNQLALAQQADILTPYAGVSYAYDDNLLRIADNKLVPGGERADSFRSAYVGVQVEKLIGRQKLEASARVSQVSYDKHDQFNYNAKNANARWAWRLGNHLDGSLRASYEQVLLPFYDFHVNERNLRTQTSGGFDGGWTFYPSWRARVGFARDKFGYDLLSQRGLDRTADGKVLGLDYYSTAGSSIGLQLRRETGGYERTVFSAGGAFKQDYTQDEIKLKVLWRVSERTQFEFLGGNANRKHDQYTISDASGLNARGTLNWQLTQNLGLSAASWREFSPFEGDVINFSVDRGNSIDLNWDFSAKLRATASAHHTRRQLSGSSPASVVLGSYDNSQGIRAGVSYLPHPKIRLSLSAYHEQRTSESLYSGSYRANGGTLSASVQF